MTPCVFQASTVLDSPAADVYAFHQDPRNIPQITPSLLKVEICRANATAIAGEDFEIVIRFLGLMPMRWHGRWHAADAPTLLVDDGLRAGPFAYWQHRHEFRPLPDGRTEMTDHVTYTFPGGWLGKLVGETAGRLQMRLMFGDRHRRTRALFS